MTQGQPPTVASTAAPSGKQTDKQGIHLDQTMMTTTTVRAKQQDIRQQDIRKKRRKTRTMAG